VNLAAKEQNKMNTGRHSPAPLPFDNNGNLHPAYGQIVRGSIRTQTGKSRGHGDTDFNPFKDGQLVTRMVSGYAGDIVEPEEKRGLQGGMNLRQKNYVWLIEDTIVGQVSPKEGMSLRFLPSISTEMLQSGMIME
jgi:hypothetical protein